MSDVSASHPGACKLRGGRDCTCLVHCCGTTAKHGKCLINLCGINTNKWLETGRGGLLKGLCEFPNLVSTKIGFVSKKLG